MNPVHHIELWTESLAGAEPGFAWLMPRLSWAAGQPWEGGRSWQHPSGCYLVLEQSPAVAGPHDRMRAGLNHLALRVGSREELDTLRDEAAAHGWRELFAEKYPHAGGPQHIALFLEDAQGFELELVVA